MKEKNKIQQKTTTTISLAFKLVETLESYICIHLINWKSPIHFPKH